MTTPDTTSPPYNANAADVLGWLETQWEQVIQTSDIGLDDNFFDVGGTSMHIVDIHSSIVDHFDLPELQLIDMFEHTTLRTLAAHIGQALGTRGGATATAHGAAAPGSCLRA